MAAFGTDRVAKVGVGGKVLSLIEIGTMAEGGFGRYARVAESGDVVTIAAYEADRLIDLLKTIGAAS